MANRWRVSAVAGGIVAALVASFTLITSPGAVAADTLISQGKPATASSSESATYPASAAVDGNTATRWSSAFSDPQWIQIDLGATYNVGQVVLNWEAAYASAFQLQTSTNGTSWTTIYSTTAGTGGLQTLTVTGSGRYIRLNGTARATPYGYSLFEFQVYGSLPGEPTPTPTERLYRLKREVLEFRRAVRPLAVPVGRLAHGQVGLVDPRTKDYFRDVEDHVLLAAERIDGFAELLTGTLSANMAQIQGRENQDMRRITAWVAILAANTLIVGIYGQNFAYMPELQWRYGYPAILVAMVVLSLTLYRGFRRNHWL